MNDFTPDLATNSLPPQNIEAEEIILGSLLFDPNAMGKVIDLLPPEAFYVNAHRQIYEAARNLYFQGQPIDLMTISTWLSDRNLLEQIGGTPKIVNLLDRTVSSANIERYVPLITDKQIRRLLINVAKEITELGYDTAKDLDQVLDESEQKIFSLTQARVQQGLLPISETLIDTFTEIQNFQEKIALPGISTNFYDLDAQTGGLQRSDLIIIAGRPSMGKTSFALNIAANVAKQHDLAVAVFSLEMSREQLAMRLLSGEARLESSRLKSGRITEQEMEPLMEAMGTLSELPIYIDDSANITVMQMRSEVRRLQAEKKGKLGLVLIDYLQLMEGGSDNRVQELSRITRSLKGLAREINAPIIALSQLSRAVEQRTNKRPMLSDLRECITGDTLIFVADKGHYLPVNKLLGQKDFQVLALNHEMKLEKSRCLDVWETGEKEIFEVETESGIKIKTSPNHPFYTSDGWKELKDISLGDFLASAQSVIDTQYCGTTSYKSNVSRQRRERIANVFNDDSVKLVAQSDINWEPVKSIEFIGKEMTYDIHVEKNHNFVANDLIIHNSGAIEQDADLVMMLYRDEYYHPDTVDKGIAEIIIAKHRNGPTGQVKLIFKSEFTQFLNMKGH